MRHKQISQSEEAWSAFNLQIFLWRTVYLYYTILYLVVLAHRTPIFRRNVYPRIYKISLAQYVPLTGHHYLH